MAFKNDMADDVAFKNDVADDMALVWPRRAPRLATLSGHSSDTPSGPVGHPIWPRWALRLALSGTPSGHPVGHPVRPPSGTPVRPPSGTSSDTPVLSRGSDRPVRAPDRRFALHLYKAIQFPIASLSPLSHLHWDL
jgi:hypothetical protein